MSRQYSDEELQAALASVADLFVDYYGLDDEEAPTDLDQSLGDFGQAVGDDDLGLASVIERLEHLYQRKIPPECCAPWVGPEAIELVHKAFSIPKEKMTGTPNFRGLAEWLLEHRPTVSIEPLNVAGANCSKAGIFCGLRDLATWTAVSDARIGPSTKLKDYFGNAEQLGMFWYHARLAVEYPLPEVPAVSRLGCLGSLFVGAVAVCFAIAENYIGALLIVLSGLAPVRALSRLDRLIWDLRPMPCGLETFGDLARFVDRYVARPV